MSEAGGIEARELRHKMTLEQEILTSEEGGGFTRTWGAVADVWVSMMPLSSFQTQGGGTREQFSHGQIQAQVSHRIWMRYRDGVHPAMRLTMGGRFFNIRSVINPMELSEMLELLVQEGVAD